MNGLSLEQPLRERHRRRLPCAAVFRTAIVRVNGDVTLCNYDLGGVLTLGNVGSTPLPELLRCEKARELKRAHLFGEGLPPICLSCTPDHLLDEKEALNAALELEGREAIWRVRRLYGTCPRLLLVNPLPSESAPFKTTVDMGLGCLAAYVRKDYYVEIIDMLKSLASPQDVVDFIKRHGFNIMGLTGMTYQWNNALKLAALVRKESPEITILAGGTYASAEVEKLLVTGLIDCIIIGEGEATLLELLQSFETGKKEMEEIKGIAFLKNGKVVRTPARERLEGKFIPAPARDLMPARGFLEPDPVFEERAALVMFSRGCPSNCIFCLTPQIWGRRVIYRPVSSMIEEIKDIKVRYGVRNFVIEDDSFTFNRDVVIEFCNALVREKLAVKFRINTRITLVDRELLEALRGAGCVKVTYGIESGSDRILKELGKGFTKEQVCEVFALHREVGLPAAMLMILGAPGETEESVRESLELVRKLQPEGGFDFQIMQPHPGTILRAGLGKTFGGKMLTEDPDEFFSDNVTYVPQAFTEKRFLALARQVTGRDIRLAGKLEKKPGEEEGEIIEIDPTAWIDSKWDINDAFHWQGDETWQKGLSHVLGKKIGYITYEFELPQGRKIDCLMVKARLGSQIPNRKSTVTLEINGYPVGSRDVKEKDEKGEEVDWLIERREIEKACVKPGKNKLTFAVREGSRNPCGLSIFYKALSPGFAGLESRIRVIINPRTGLKGLLDKGAKLLRATFRGAAE